MFRNPIRAKGRTARQYTVAALVTEPSSGTSDCGLRTED
jgi:hypothetical protein